MAYSTHEMSVATRTRGVGLLAGLTLVIAGGTIVQDCRFDSSLARERAAALVVDREWGSLSVALANLHAAQAGYLASGQDPAFWMTQVGERSSEIDATIKRRRAAATVEGKLFDTALSALTALTAVDGRARAQIRADERIAASDLVFVDSTEAIARLTGALDAARSAELSASEYRLSRVRTLRGAIDGIALAFVAAVVVFLWKTSGTHAPAKTNPRPQTPPATQPHAGPPPPPPHPSALNLADAAALCGDLARVVDTRDVAALFDRAAAVLAAKGAVLWVPDAAGAMLRPSLTHGYSERLLAKMGPLQVDAENLTSLAYRSMRPQTVNGAAPGSPGAIAVPLISPSGCVGVLAAETRLQKPGHDVLPLAQMIAAQLAALVTTTEVAGQKTG